MNIVRYLIKRKYNNARFKFVLFKKGCPGNFTPSVRSLDFISETKSENNLIRARSAIFELGYCNPWELFCTFTLDQTKYDRFNLRLWIKDFSQFVRDFRKSSGDQIKYLFIPEMHSDGAWHIHGFISGLSPKYLHQFSEKEKLPYSILKRLKAGHMVFTWPAYVKKFGFSSLEVIEHRDRSVKYITKYMTKDHLRSVSSLGAHLYYASQGLKRSLVIQEGYLTGANQYLDSPDFENDFIQSKWILLN